MWKFSFAVALIFFEPIALNASTLSSLFSVGDTLTGSVSYNLEDASPDIFSLDAGRGGYEFDSSSASMMITIGAASFSTSISPNLLIRVTDSPSFAPGQSDFIQISSNGNESSFSNLLTGFSRQHPSLDPRGSISLNFHFPNTYLSDDSLPALFDPLATTGPVPGSSFQNIFGGIEGVSTQTPGNGIREWAIFFSVAPEDVTVNLLDNQLTLNFIGSINEVDDRALFGPYTEPVGEVPLPSSLPLLVGGIICLGLSRRKQRR